MLVLETYLEAWASPIGHLVKGDDGGLAFTYAADWLASTNNHALSLSLPLREEPFDDVPVRAWFDNLLQENDRLDAVMAREGIARNDIAGLLAHLGTDCAGAVSLLEPGSPPIKRPGDLQTDYDELNEEELREIVERLATGKPLPNKLRDPSPVAGVRPKISLAAVPSGRFALPREGTGAPTTHILKLPDRNHPNEARDEAFVTWLAAQCGFPVGNCVANEVGGREVLLIERFDRIVDGNAIYRTHVEDFAQATGLPAELKYERRGGEERRFDAQQIGRILASTDRPILSRDLFLRMTLFNFIVGNNDNHAKNHGLIHSGGGSIILAPFYDLVPVQVVDDFTDEFAFKLGAAARPDELTMPDLEAFCADIGLPRSGAGRLLSAAARDLVERIEGLSEGFPRDMKIFDNMLGETLSQLDELLGLGATLRERDAHVTSGGGWSIS